MSIIIPANSAVSGGFNVANSLMFNSADSANLSRTNGGSAGSETKSTLSAWIKISSLGDDNVIFQELESSGNFFSIKLKGGDFQVNAQNNSSAFINVRTNRVLRDFSAWYHLVVAIDGTQGTSSNRIKMYINGVQETSFSTATYPPQNQNCKINQANEVQYISNSASSEYFNGYMSEVVWLDGTVADPTSFGEFDEDSGIWKPIDVSGLTFGTNGFYLDFEDSSALGNDAVGSNNFTANNLAATDQGTDTCTNNFATMNPLNVPASNAPTFASGNTYSQSVSGGTSVSAFSGSSTIGVTSGKWYIEAKAVTTGSSRSGIGISGEASKLAKDNNSGTSGSNSSYLYSSEAGIVYSNTSSVSGYASYTNNDIIGIAVDLTNLKVYFSKNGVFGNSSNPSTGSNGISITALSSTTDGAYFIIGGSTAGGGASSAYSAMNHNFGSPYYAISSGNADGGGFGNFEYAVPSGFFALCTKNLAEYG